MAPYLWGVCSCMVSCIVNLKPWDCKIDECHGHFLQPDCNSTCTGKVKLAVSAGALATSDDGAWVCLANKAGLVEGGKRTYELNM